MSKQRYDLHRPNIQYEIGQLVLAKSVIRNNKMKTIFEGPYSVVNKLGPVTYEIRLEHLDYIRRVHNIIINIIWIFLIVKYSLCQILKRYGTNKKEVIEKLKSGEFTAKAELPLSSHGSF